MSGGVNVPVEENAYEKLSREVHQMQVTGAIHTEWLENPKGYLMKPDFKRKMQKVGAGGKKLNTSRVLRLHLPGSSYRTRWFVLDGMVLRYFKTESQEQELGAIHLPSVNAVLPSSVSDAPEHALDLVCADRIYTIAGKTREDIVRWATVLTLVLRGEYKPKLMQRLESAIIRGSSMIPRPSSMPRKPSQHNSLRFTDVNNTRTTAGRMFTDESGGNNKQNEDGIVKEKIITVTFDEPGPLQLVLRATIDDEIMVCGFQRSNINNSVNVLNDTSVDSDIDPGIGPAEASGVIRVGDILTSVNNAYFASIDFQKAINLIQQAGRPLTLRFSRLEGSKAKDSESSSLDVTMSTNQQSRVAQGWVLVKESAAYRYRIRMLQLSNQKLYLYKPGVQETQMEKPCLVVNMAEVKTIRPSHDATSSPIAQTQLFTKHWGITLEGVRNILTFYTKNESDMMQWIDLLKNCLLFQAVKDVKRIPIPTHLVSSVLYDRSDTKPVLSDKVMKVGDLFPTLFTYDCELSEDGKLKFFLPSDSQDSTFNANTRRSITTINCESLLTITPGIAATNPKDFFTSSKSSLATDNNTSYWRLDLGVVQSNAAISINPKQSHLIVLFFESQDKLRRWSSAISREAHRLTGNEYNISNSSPASKRSARSHSRISHTQAHYYKSDITKSKFPHLIANSSKYIETSLEYSLKPRIHLNDVMVSPPTKAWFMVRRPRGASGAVDVFYPRFLVLRNNNLLMYKFEALEDNKACYAASNIDLRTVKDVRDYGCDGLVQGEIQLEYTIEIVISDNEIWVLGAENYQQKESWLSKLIWLSDYYYQGVAETGSNTQGYKSPQKRDKRAAMKIAGLMDSIPEADGEGRTSSFGHSSDLSISTPKNSPYVLPSSIPAFGTLLHKHSEALSDEFSEIRGWLVVSGKHAFAVICCGTLIYYENQEDCDNEWGNPIDAINLRHAERVRSIKPIMDTDKAAGYCFEVIILDNCNGKDKSIVLSADSEDLARRWMLVICFVSGLLLTKSVTYKEENQITGWTSSSPKEAWIWKMDRLHQIFRRRYFSLRNHELMYSTDANGRQLGVVYLSRLIHVSMSKVCTRNNTENADFYQLEISFATPATRNSETGEVITSDFKSNSVGYNKLDSPSKTGVSKEDDVFGDFFALLLAFDTENEMREWINSIYECCQTSMSNISLPPIPVIQTLPKDLLKACTFDRRGRMLSSTSQRRLSQCDPKTQKMSNFSGWLYYCASPDERIRQRYFIQWGYELSIYKHEVLPDESSAIRYGVIDCRALVDVRFALSNAPENAVELLFPNNIRVLIVPPTDDEAVMWRESLLQIKQAYGYLNNSLDSSSEMSPLTTMRGGVFISRGSTFSTQKDNEDLLRQQIETSVVYSANLQDWDGTKWIPKYFVLTNSRVLILSLAVHLYDEEHDILTSFATKHIIEVRSCTLKEQSETGQSNYTCVVTYRLPVSPTNDENINTEEKMFMRCDSSDHCLEWMRLLCFSNGKLELKRNAATGLWGSVHRLATVSSQGSFLKFSSESTTTTNGNPKPLLSRKSSNMMGEKLSSNVPSSLGEKAKLVRSRQDSTRRRTSELLLNRQMTMR